MRPLSSTFRRGLFTLSLIGALAACGGGSAPEDGAQSFAARIAQQDTADQRKQALAAGDPVDAKALLDWIEFKFPSLFPRGPASVSLDYGGVTYTIRAYAHAGGTRYAGVTAGGEVYGLGDFTNNQLQRFGTLADFASQINADSCNVYPGSCPTAAAGLPADLLSRPAHPDCPALRSGTYRWLNPAESDPDWNTFVSEIDAPTGKVTWPDKSTDTATSTGNCTFTTSAGRMVVSAAGVIVNTSRNQNNQQTFAIGFPEQATSVGDLAGVSNWLSYEVYDNSAAGKRWRTGVGTTEFDAAGRQIALSDCDARSACVAKPGPFGALRVNPAGGFDSVDPNNTVTLRIFGYRPGSGDLTWFGIQDGMLIVSTRQKSLAMPAVGDLMNAWNLESGWTGAAGTTFSESLGSVTAIDTSARTYTRTLSTGRNDVFLLDEPRFGLRYRVGTATTAELIGMPLPGLGMTAYAAVVTSSTLSRGVFGLSIVK